jgi:hypothetical protein
MVIGTPKSLVLLEIYYFVCSLFSAASFFSTNVKPTLAGPRMNYKMLYPPPLYPKLTNDPRPTSKDEEGTSDV